MSVLLALPWFLAFLTLVRLAKKTPSLSALAPVAGPPISVIIPARNEAETIETVVRSVLASQYPRLELLVVDDRSTDATAAIVSRLAAQDPRLRLLPGAELPAGWYGKPWACHQGSQAATGDLLVFTDADTRHGPELLGRSVAALEQSGADALTLAPRQLCLGFWERIVMPQIWMLLGLRFHPDRVNRARRARDVIANGQFVMFRRETYQAIGGHTSVRSEVAEDLALAHRLYRAGKRFRFVFAEEQMQTRMYTGLAHLIEGWSKNVYLGGRRSYPDEPLLRALVPVGLAAALLFWLLPVAAAVLALAGLLDEPFRGAAYLATGASALYWVLVVGGMRIPLWYGLGYPLGALTALFIVLRSSLRGARRVEWKGRSYDAAVNR